METHAGLSLLTPDLGIDTAAHKTQLHRFDKMRDLELLRSGQQHGIKKLKLTGDNNLSEFPLEILELSESLEILDLSGNPLSSLPEDIGRLHKLKIAFFSDCNFSIFPKQLAQCPALEMIAFKGNGMTTVLEDSFPPNLRWLILTNNKITSLPRSIGNSHRLQKCMLAGNLLRELPEEMKSCRKLGLLRISANKIEELPHWLSSMPELSFMAFAGNPCAPTFQDNPVLDDIVWDELVVTSLLGEGASGIISKGTWLTGKEEKEVAVKLFKGEVTSDGSPIDEMNATITAGSHPNLIDPIGKIVGHPGKRGLVLQLIPPVYTNLGLPPTLDTCTRDSFPENMQFSFENVKAILRGIASAAAHLHARGISHGDLYAHNILIDDQGHALLGDYGAATIYQTTHANADLLERMEALAFGHLIEDMMGLIRFGDKPEEEEDYKEAGQMEKIWELRLRCISRQVKARPGFAEILEVLELLET